MSSRSIRLSGASTNRGNGVYHRNCMVAVPAWKVEENFRRGETPVDTIRIPPPQFALPEGLEQK